MIGVNPLRKKVLITTDEVLFHAPVDNDVDVRTLLNSIIIAEVRFIKDLIGVTVYDELVEAKNVLVTDVNKASLETLLNDTRPDDRAEITLQEGDFINSDTYLSVTQQGLWQNCLHKIVAEAVWFCALPVNRSRFTSQGVIHNFPQEALGTSNSVSVDLRTLKHLMDRGLQDRISPLIEDMHQYMCITHYPGYTKDCGCDGKGKTVKTDLILSMYEDEEDGCGCRKRNDYY